MRVEGQFEVTMFTPVTLDPAPAQVTTALPVGVVAMIKQFSGAIDGHSATIFTSAFDQASGRGTYVAMESFEGSVDGRAGSFNFVHTASTDGAERSGELLQIVAGSGTGELAAIRGHGGLSGTHDIWLEYEVS